MKIIGLLLQVLGMSLRNGMRMVVALLLVTSLALNIAMFIGGVLYNAASSAFHAATGLRTVAMQHADEVADLSGELSQERAAKRKAKSELTEATGDLAAERATTKKLRSELKEAVPTVVFKGKRVAAKAAVATTAGRISRRAAATSTREIGSMAGEALPYLGIAVIVGATMLELKDICDTLKDMNELRKAFDPDAATSDEQHTVCAQRVPTRAELWVLVKSSPGEVWERTRNAVPALSEMKNYELPIVDWKLFPWLATEAVDTVDAETQPVERSWWDVAAERASNLVDETRVLIWSDGGTPTPLSPHP
ncbi:MAG: hypothetical protein VR71_03280 [Roseovarius sp. BRH_c41]|uniref:hypothetical protein n=1 Tax=Roseovarius sp. BRH_c41 TaxID=1629709 RepID=UPI0005F23238|nr:hypothetical protein [Roseovarius sp. BRH_c41]KJS45093.1 MAG: hypothetical protein VR71_03280 [Roseovarius sp. BRH_c41]